jgi:hypothetical protein
MITVRPVERKGCLWTAGGVLSLGLMPLLLRAHERQLPATLTDEEMVLRNGKRIPWSQFTGATGTKVYLEKTYVGTRWILKHPGGKVVIQTNQIHDPDQVMEFIMSHLPPQALNP